MQIKTLRYTTCLALSALCLLPIQAKAESSISVGASYVDIIDDEKSAGLRLEYRSGYDLIYGIKPLIGGEVTTDHASHGFVGAYRDFQISENWYFTPSVVGGLYANGSGPDLDHFIQFRSMIEIGYQINDSYKISAGLSHISNADLGDSNPGSESATLYIHRAWP